MPRSNYAIGRFLLEHIGTHLDPIVANLLGWLSIMQEI